jgi:glucosamine--fructose-6-phosphate aminotransferase (isomerizing)
MGYVGSGDALTVILSGLEKLEYRGYDSAGVAIVDNGVLQVVRAKGKLNVLKQEIEKLQKKISGSARIGLGHTRWATHGKPSQENAHPHSADSVSIIHNGIIENYSELREELQREGAIFLSETDTEVAAHLISREIRLGKTTICAVRDACSRLRGSYAILVLDLNAPDRIFVAKTGTPLVIGLGEDENFIASDIPAVLSHTKKVVILEDGDLATVTSSSVIIENSGLIIDRTIQQITWDPVTAQKGGFPHFMSKEIYEQGSVVSDTLIGKLDSSYSRVNLSELNERKNDLLAINRIIIVGCGTAYYAGLMVKFYIERFAGIPVEVDYSSEFRYRDIILSPSTLVLAISQSGETADTLAAVDRARPHAMTLAICNVVGSSLTRKVENTIYTNAGPEISVASTKAFITQLIAGYLLALYIAQERNSIKADSIAQAINAILHVPAAIDDILRNKARIEQIAQATYKARDYLFLGRGFCYPIALEGALKLKEISYIHAEGYPAGEIKHGPIALVDDNVPVVVLLPRTPSELFEKTFSNLREVESRGALIIAVTDTEGHPELANLADYIVETPHLSELLSPLAMTVPLQLLAYNIAVLNGADVDLPRNLAKSVTVE